MARLIQDKVKQPLAEELLFGKLAHGGEVSVTVKEGEDGTKGLTFVLTPAPPRLDRKAGKPKGKAPETARAAPSPKPRVIMTDRPDL
jgi:ATP-dependent Clp protease ATP-binding subunit ClpA